MPVLQWVEYVALWSRGLAPECHLQTSSPGLISVVSSSGGGLPGRLDLERVRGVRHFGAQGAGQVHVDKIPVLGDKWWSSPASLPFAPAVGKAPRWTHVCQSRTTAG